MEIRHKTGFVGLSCAVFVVCAIRRCAGNHAASLPCYGDFFRAVNHGMIQARRQEVGHEVASAMHGGAHK